MPQTFDVRPSPALATTPGDLLEYPDELMIDWGDTPAGSTASIYWPQVAATDVLALAKRIIPRTSFPPPMQIPYSARSRKADLLAFLFHRLRHKLRRSVYGRSASRNTQRAGLHHRCPHDRHAAALSPVRLAASGTRAQTVVPASEKKLMNNWRYVVGSFAVRIPVTTARVMLPLEENALAIMKWRLLQTSPSNRWYPVLQRFVSYIAGRVDGLGGNSGLIQPSPWGLPPSKAKPSSAVIEEFTGKVREVIFDRFGDFEGFVLETFSRDHHFIAHEKNIGELVLRACKERLALSVFEEHGAGHKRKVLRLIVRS